MRTSTIILSFFAALTIAAPTSLSPRAGVLGTKTYDQLSISGGVAGNAQAEALAKFAALDGIADEDVDAADIDFLGAVNDIANDAETDAFNVAIEKATGDAKIALQNGKIKNKVLKLQATIVELRIRAAQGEDTAAKAAAELKKLNNNIALDKAQAGKASTALKFSAST